MTAEMRSDLKTAVFALVASGACLGFSSNLAKLASGEGLSPLAFLGWPAFGSAIILSIILAYRRRLPSLTRRSVEYFFVAAFLTVAGSNLILFHAIPQIGVNLVALVMTLPPLLTYTAALFLAMEKFDWRRASGVLLAFAGVIYLTGGELRTRSVDAYWIGLALLAPVLLAAGNIYRSKRWPHGEDALALAPGLLWAAAIILLPLAAIPGFDLAVPVRNPEAIALLFAQTLIFTLQYSLLFVLQKAGGPVFLSLLGGMSAVVAIPIAILLLDEPLPDGLAWSAAAIAAGTALVAFGGSARRRASAMKTPSE